MSDKLETPIMQDIRREFGRMKNGRLLRYNVGALYDKDGRLVHYGIPGHTDLAGIMDTSAVCPSCSAAIPSPGRWVGLEVKSESGVVEPDQALFHRMIRRYGGLVAVVRSVEEARDAMRGWGAKW